MTDREDGPFTLTAANLPFAVLPGLTLMFTLAPAAAPAVPLAFSGLLFGFFGAILGLLTYRAVHRYGLMARIGALTGLCLVLGGASLALTTLVAGLAAP